MKRDKPSYEELQERLLEAESVLESIRKGKVDLLLGETQPLVIQLKSVTEEKDKLLKENLLLANEWIATFEAIESLIWVIDKQNKILKNNKNSLEGFGFDTENPVGKNYFDIVQFSDAQSLDSPLFRAQISLKREREEVKIGDQWFEFIVDPIIYNGYRGAVHLINNITPQKQSEQNIKENEDRLQKFFIQSADGFFFMALDEPIEWNDTVDKEKVLDYVFEHHRVTKVNSAMLQLFGTTEAQFIELKPDDFFRHDIKHGRQLWRDFFDNGQLHMDTKEKKDDGSDLIINGDYICLYDSKGRITGHFGIQRDVTEIRRKEEIYLKSNVELEEYFENDISADYVVSEEGEIFSCNKTFLKLFGFENKSHTERFNISQLYKNPNDRKELLQKVKEFGRAENFELVLVTLEGKEVNVIMNAIGFFDNTGKLIKTRGYVVDITARKKMEEDLRKSEGKFKEMANLLPQIIFEADKDGVLTYVNDKAYKLFGFSKKEFNQKMNMLQLIDPKDRARATANMQLVMDGAPLRANEYNVIKKDGTNFPVFVYLSPIIDKGKTIGLRGTIIDITDRKLAEKELLESEKKYRLLFANNPQPMWIYDLETLAFLEVNRAAINHYGYSREEFLSMSLKDIRPAEDIPALMDDIEKTRSNLNSAGEWRHLKKNGEIIVVEINSHSVISNNRNARHVLINDITERKQSENEILKLSQALEQSPVSIIITDLKGNMEYVNTKLLEITAYAKEELIGKNPRIFSSGDKSKEEYRQLWSAILAGREWFGEFHNKKKNGELYWEFASISPIVDAAGAITHFLAVKEDITERKESEKLLQDQTNLLSNVLKMLPVGLWIIDKEGNIIHGNPAGQKIWAGSKYVGIEQYGEYKGWWLDTHELIKPGEWAAARAITNKEVSLNEEIEIECFDGTHKIILNSAVPIIGADGNLDAAIVLNEDITQRKINEEELIKAKDKAEESDRLKSAFLANMSHEIRTPMNGILGFTELLLNPDLNSEEKESYINIVHKSGQRMLSTVTDIVEISKIEAGLVKISNKEIDVNETVNELVRFFRPEAEKKGLELSIEMLLPDAKKHLLADQSKLDSIITNLIKNAIKYTETGTIKVGCQLKSTGVEFYVKDTGIGIPVHRQEAVFNRFEQADIADTRAFQGSGLGLAISKSYVEMLGGKIWVESEEGSGSTFYFTLPANSNLEEKLISDKEISVHNEKTKPNVKGLKILIAEDDETSRQFLSILIKDIGNEILEVQTGSKALKLCRQHPDIDLVLMDIQMPGMNGLEATRRIREFNKKVIIIAQTAFGLSGDREKAIEAGCDDYISKPIKKDELLALIQKYFKK